MYATLFSKRGLSFDRLRVLVEVASAGSIVKAAGADPVRQSQYSRQLKELEAFFECKLTERKGRTLTLTPAGQQLANLAREQFNVLAHFASERGQTAPIIRIGAGESLIKWLIIPNLHQIKMDGNSINWRFANLQSAEIMDQILDQRLDFGLVRGAKETAPRKSTRLGRLENALFVPASMTTALPSKLSTEAALAQLPMAVLEGRSRIRQLIEDSCKKERREPNIRFECATQPEIAEVVRQGLAAGILPRISGVEFAGTGVKEFNLNLMPHQDIDLSLVWNPRTLSMSGNLDTIRGALAKALHLGMR